ncbi:hypothetical protein SKAU_G00258610 [Synaphobranchus kaupii]|uniref:Tubulin polyglutamylase TTLL4 n=1 Tax=Synaphobranchus kaupii TaxID=118154 RepID=A0A9Q1F4D7_SYNKA|nr:hypothetical protein SKAU_G00258610 [Synaphobranchus kaupii]
MKWMLEDPTCSQDRKLSMSAAATATVRAAEDQLICASGIHPPAHGYLFVPPGSSATTRAGGIWDVCASCANAIRDGGKASAVVPANPRPSSVPPVTSPIPLEPSAPGSGPSWPSEPLRLRSVLLGKRPQPSSAYPTCPSPPKAASTMPTNQSSPWDSHRLRGNCGGTVRLSDAKVPSRPRRESAPSSLPASGCYGEPVLLRASEPLQERWRILTLDQATVGQNLTPDRTLQPASQNLDLKGPYGSVGWQQLETGKAVDTYRMTMLRLTGGVSHLRTGGSSGVESCSSWIEAAQTPSRPVSPPSVAPPPSSPPFPPLAPCPSNGAEEPCSVPMDTSSAPCLDSSSCVCSVSCSAVVGRGGTADRTQSNCASSQRHSVSSVTTQISSIHLSKESHPRSGDPCSLKPPLQDESTTSQETLAKLPDCGGEEELSDKLENQCSGDDDDDDDGSETSVLSDASAVMLALSNVEELTTSADGRTEKPALVPSLFPSTPPTLYFSTANERVEMFPPELSSLLKWKISSVTPNVVKHTLARSHFKFIKEGHDWLGCWGHHMRSHEFRAIHEHQKLNHFPGSFQIGRKDRLWRNLSKMQILFGRQEFSFFPRSFVLPQDMRLLRKAWVEGSWLKWIVKPPASARGNGIQVIHRWSQLPRRRPLLVQKYLHKPFLIGGSKFDLRIYVYVSSYDPLRIYIFTDGLVRFASCKYSSSMKNLSNKFMHLTNYSVNKENSEYQSNSDEQTCQGHKWALKALWQYLVRKGVNTTQIWDKIKDIVIKTIIVADPYVNKLIQTHVRSAYSCHELFGFDIMLDENLKPWLLEVNISPSLHSSTALDLSVKGQMVRDVLNLAGIVLPQQEAVDAADTSSSSSSSVCAEVKDSAGLESQLAPDEKVKRIHYESQRFADQAFLSSVLDVLTPGDVRTLVEAEDELSRCGEFERVFPSPVSLRYMRFFRKSRYLNILLSQWEQRHWANRSQGVSLLRMLCQKGVHLGSPSDPAYAWSPKSSAGQKLDPAVNLSHTQDDFTSGMGSMEEDLSQGDLWSGASSLSDIHLLGSQTPSPASHNLHPQNCV